MWFHPGDDGVNKLANTAVIGNATGKAISSVTVDHPGFFFNNVVMSLTVHGTLFERNTA